MPHYAHSLPGDPDRTKWEMLSEHLEKVAVGAGESPGARQFAESFGAADWSELLGWWHDLGKYSDKFQAYLAESCDPDDLEKSASSLGPTPPMNVYSNERRQYRVERLMAFNRNLASANKNTAPSKLREAVSLIILSQNTFLSTHRLTRYELTESLFQKKRSSTVALLKLQR